MAFQYLLSFQERNLLMWKPLILVVAAAIVAPLADAGRAVAAPVPAPPATKTITVLTYNTHLFEDPDGKYNNVAVWGASTVAKKKVTYDDDNRARLIAEKVKSCGADIVGLQEVWAFKRQKWFATLLSKTYPYAYYPPKPKVVKKFALSEVVIGFSNGKLTGAGYISPQVTTSGLVLLSKYPLTNPGFSPFPARKAHKLDDFKDQDFWAGKGIITATVPLSPGGPTFRVGVSHAYVDAGGPSLQNPAQLAASTMAGWMPAIVMGDLNVSSSTGDYAKMQTIFRQFDATDAYVDAYKKMHPGSDPRSMKDSYTVNWQINLLSQVFSNRAGDGKCLDYVFVKNSGPFLTLQPEETRVIRDWNYPIQSFSFTDKKDIEGRIFALKTDKGLPVKMMVRVVDQNKTKWKRNAVLELRYVVYDKNNPKGRRSGIAKLGPRVDWKGKNEWIISGLD
ncbi:MAG: endonuclease/exonuclease/phosphatase family protein, partial [Pirellulales bacterium]|nr:endonuclease/exonuclease/phosphatase family protein [Pirellulales bacterium]